MARPLRRRTRMDTLNRGWMRKEGLIGDPLLPVLCAWVHVPL